NRVLPMPNDILRSGSNNRIAIPIDAAAIATMSAAELALDALFNQRDAWPSRMAADLSFSGAIDMATLGASSVRVFETPSTDGAMHPIDVSVRIDHPDHLIVDPPANGWTRGALIEVAVLGGDAGLRGAAGEPVVADAAFTVVRATTPSS